MLFQILEFPGNAVIDHNTRSCLNTQEYKASQIRGHVLQELVMGGGLLDVLQEELVDERRVGS